MNEENKKININRIQDSFYELEKLNVGLESFNGASQLMTKGFGDAEKNIKQQTNIQTSQTNTNTVKLIIPKDN